MRRILPIVAFWLLGYSLYAQSQVEESIRELEEARELLAVLAVSYELEEEQFADPLWIRDADGSSRAVDAKRVQRQIERTILLSELLGMRDRGTSLLPSALQATYQRLGENKTGDGISVAIAMSMLRSESAAIRAETFSDINNMAQQIKNELAELRAQQRQALATSQSRDTERSQETYDPYDISGSWLFGENNETWTFTKLGDGTYSAQESGYGNASGTATVKSSRLHIKFRCPNGRCWGTYDGQIADDGETIDATRSDGKSFVFKR
ncbi:MAG: hypothetical protein AAF098_19935 [Pseudomonadota bacterium]